VTDFTIACLVPVLARSHRVSPLIESVRAAAKVTPVRVVFLATEGDDAEQDAVRAYSGQSTVTDVALLVVPEEREGWNKKINDGFEATQEPFVFCAADDVSFVPGCFERMLATHLETGACVVGSNDDANPSVRAGQHATHFLVCREYLECGTVDAPDSGLLLHEQYAHAFVDNECVQTAMARKTFAAALDAHVPATHPLWGTAPMDSTYAKGQASFDADRRLYHSREHLWKAL
jgi:hypothetical protein